MDEIPLKSGNPWNLVEDDRPQHLWGSMKNLVGNPWSMDHPKGHPLFGRLDFQASWAKSNEKPAQKSRKKTSFSSFPSIISLPFLPYKTTIQPFQTPSTSPWLQRVWVDIFVHNLEPSRALHLGLSVWTSGILIREWSIKKDNTSAAVFVFEGDQHPHHHHHHPTASCTSQHPCKSFFFHSFKAQMKLSFDSFASPIMPSWLMKKPKIWKEMKKN